MKNLVLFPLIVSALLYISSLILFVAGRSRALAVLLFSLASVLLCLCGRNRRKEKSQNDQDLQ